MISIWIGWCNGSLWIRLWVGYITHYSFQNGRWLSPKHSIRFSNQQGCSRVLKYAQVICKSAIRKPLTFMCFSGLLWHSYHFRKNREGTETQHEDIGESQGPLRRSLIGCHFCNAEDVASKKQTNKYPPVYWHRHGNQVHKVHIRSLTCLAQDGSYCGGLFYHLEANK